jgi:hypothetical protein
LLGRSEGKRLLGSPRHRWEDNIKMDLQEIGCGGMDWIELAQDRHVAGICECGNESSCSIKCGNFLTSCNPVSFSRKAVLHGVSE